jgi:hypothetical protein
MTLVAGAGAATVSNEILSLGSSYALVVVSPSPPATNVEPPVLTVAGEIVSAAVGTDAIVVGSLTIAAGGPGVTVSGTPISVAASGVVVVGTSSIPIAVPPAIAIGSQVYGVSSIESGEIIIASQTIKPEGPAVTISGIPVSLGPSDMLIIGTLTVDLAANPVCTTVPPAITIGTQVYGVSSIGSGDIIVASQILTPGGAAITISGVPISLAPSDVLIVGTSTVELTPNPVITYATANTSHSIGGTPFYGEATTTTSCLIWVVFGTFILLGAVMV